MAADDTGKGALSETVATIIPDSDRQKGLSVGGALTLSGTVSISLPAAHCSSVGFFCIHVTPHVTAPISDPISTNDRMCESVISRIRCETGKMNIFTLIPRSGLSTKGL